MESEDEELFNFKSLKRFRTSKRQQDDHLATAGIVQRSSSNRTLRNSKLERKSLQRENKSNRKSLEPLPAPKCSKRASVSSELLLTCGQELPENETNDCGDPHDTDTVILTNDEGQTEVLTQPEEINFDCINSENSIKRPDSDKSFRTLPCNPGHDDKVEDQLREKCRKQLFTCSDDLLISQSTNRSKSQGPADGVQRKRAQTPKAVSPVLMKKRATSLQISRSSIGNEKVTAPKKDEGRIYRTEAESEKNRCPFCQMPFQVLHNQWLNWHTMECMDIPLKATEECPAGLTCESTIPSHYRRFTHLKIALHLAGHQPVEHWDIDQEETESTSSCPIPSEVKKTSSQEGQGSRNHTSQQSQGSRNSQQSQDSRHCTPQQSRTSRNRTSQHSWGCTSQQSQGSRNRTPQKSRGSRNHSKRQNKKSVSSSSAKDRPSGEAAPSESQGSQKSSSSSNCSIRSFFSPSGKKAASSDKLLKKCSSKEHEDFDPVLKLLVMSDSDSDAGMDQDVAGRENKKTEEEGDDDGCDAGEWEGEQAHCFGSEAEEDEAAGGREVDNVSENCGSGLVQEAITQEALLDNSDAGLIEKADNLSKDLTYLDHSADSYQTLPMKNQVNPTAKVTAVSMQKQTSLFSFFKPQCHSSNAQNNHLLNGAKAVSKPQFPKQGLGKNWKMSSDAAKKIPPVKSASDPVVMLRIPSPPPCVQVKSVHPAGNAKPPPSRGRPSTPSASTSWQKSSGRQCPFYKKLPGTAITVDAFRYGEIPGCQAYVLTHFHYDHYQGLTKRFSQPLFCSSVTANLVEKQIGVASRWVNRLPLNTPSQVAGVWLTLMDANHCPGAVIILFELPNGKKLLHTGDFRADPCMEQYPPLVNISVDELYLDTTYCDPAHAFPSQREAIQFAVSTALKAMEREPRTLVVCGAYTIGKERIFMALAEALQTKVCVQSAKKRVLDCLDDNRLKSMVTLKWTEGSVHVLPMRQLNARGLQEHLERCPQFRSVLAFEPTGWTHSNKVLSLDTLRPKFSCRGITVYGVPYSEHSSFLEMKRFVQFLRPRKILPTVNNGNPASRRKMEAIFSQWLSERHVQTQSVPGSSKDSASTQQSLGAWLNKCLY